ncbi:Interactor of constitutive active ROPs 1 [Abeliophyllum distichum]|uniref:Interactor of constitutive active ROPs 1 n=1 Tax=Abeliophyllum distichum TaxID=126358 RepID=A0ABD1PS17_9LAMI
MQRSRVAEMHQKKSTRGPPHLRKLTSNSDPLHNRLRTDTSRKLADGQPPRGAQSEPANQKKLGTRIADLESHLGQAQEELKSLKDQLALGNVSKNATQKQVEKRTKKQEVILEPLNIQENDSIAVQTQESYEMDNNIAHETSDENQQETDVFEVPVEKITMEQMTELSPPSDQEELESKSVGLSTESPAASEPEKPSLYELSLKNDELKSLKAKLKEKEKELEVFREENESLKNQLNEKLQEISSVGLKGDEITSRLNHVEQELERSKSSTVQLNEKLEAAENAKDELETEMKKLQVITEQWRKAADAAASVLAGDVETNGRRISQRCGSMDMHIGNVFKPVDLDSQGLVDDADDVLGGGKRKGSGIRIVDLWKKKGQK